MRSGFNAKFIVDKKIVGVGSIISLVRSGDVIPHYPRTVIKPSSEPMMPEVEYKWNDTEVDIIIADKKQNYTVNKKDYDTFFKTIEE